MTIGEFSKAVAMGQHTLRYYEKKELLRVERDSRGRRTYSENDVEWVGFITRLKETGMLLRDIRTYAQLRYAGEETISERLKMLERHRLFVEGQIHRWNGYLDNLDDKIRIYREKQSGGRSHSA